MVRMFGSRMFRAASTASSLSPRRRHCRLIAPADERQQQVLQGVVRFPQFAGIDVVDALPHVGLAHAAHPVGGEVAVVELLHLPGQPALDVDAVGDVSDGDFLFDAPRPEMGPHAPGDVAVQVAHGVGPARKLQAQHGHAEGFVLVLRLDAPQAHQLLGRDAQLVAQRAKVLFDQVAVEAVVAGGHGRVRGEDGVLGHLAQGGVEAHAVVLHPRADGLERGERAVAFVEMIDARRDAQGLQRPHAAHAGHQFLADAGAVVAAVEPGGQLAVLGAVARHVAIQQVELHPADVHQPDLGQQLAGAGVDADGDRLAVGAQGGLHRQVLDLRVEILLVLPAVDVEMLLEIALVVEQPDGHQRHAQPAGALDVVAGKHAQAAGIDGHRLVDAELQREIGHRLRAEHAGVGPPPRRGSRSRIPSAGERPD